MASIKIYHRLVDIDIVSRSNEFTRQNDNRIEQWYRVDRPKEVHKPSRAIRCWGLFPYRVLQ